MQPPAESSTLAKRRSVPRRRGIGDCFINLATAAALTLAAGWILQSMTDSVIPPLRDLQLVLPGSQVGDALVVRRGFEAPGAQGDEDPGGWFVEYRFKRHTRRGLLDRVKRERVNDDLYQRLAKLDAVPVRYALDAEDVFRLDGNPSIGFHLFMLLIPLGIALNYLYAAWIALAPVRVVVTWRSTSGLDA